MTQRLTGLIPAVLTIVVTVGVISAGCFTASLVSPALAQDIDLDAVFRCSATDDAGTAFTVRLPL